MTSYFISFSVTRQKELFARLGRLVQLRSLEVDLVSQTLASGDVCFASGEGIALLSEDRKEQLAGSILQQTAHLIVTPPYPGGSCPWPFHNVPPPEFHATSFASVTIEDEELQQVIGQAELTILYNQSMRASVGRPVAVTGDGEAVIVRYQHRSTWGQLVYTTLLLHSTSSRSRRPDRLALAQGLVSWLSHISQQEAAPTVKVSSAWPDLNYEHSIVLLAVSVAQQDGVLVEEELRSAVARLRVKLLHDQDSFRLDEAMVRLETTGILCSTGQGHWTVHVQELAEAINHEHLASYLRRLS